jgi:hypothetical protein
MNKFKITKRSFYGKWLYKVSLRMEGISFLRYTPLHEIENKILAYIDDGDGVPNWQRYMEKVANNKDNIIRLAMYLQQYEKSTYCLRCETDIVDIYTNEKNMFDTCVTEFDGLLRFAFSPDHNDISILQNHKNIVVKKYPHNKYRFKVYLKPHKNIDHETKKNFIKWLESQQEKITFSESVKKWFFNTNWNWDRRYILVDNDQTLLMMKLKNSDYIGSVYEYIVSDK